MSILKIARMGHPLLSRPAERVADPCAPEIAALVADMLETLADIGGLGLAAPQVHVSRRVVVFHVPRQRVLVEEGQGAEEEGAEDAEGPDMTVLVNPVVEPLGDETALGWEGCLSVPGLRGLVPRHTRISYSGHSLTGERIERVAEGFHARVVQHECDHLDGILYPQRMTDMRKLVFESEMKHALAETGENP